MKGRKPIPSAREVMQAVKGKPQSSGVGTPKEIIGATFNGFDANGKVKIIRDDEKLNPPANSKGFNAVLPVEANPAIGSRMVYVDLEGVGEGVVMRIGPPGSSQTIPVGASLTFFGNAAPSGWLILDGTTVGSAASGSANANAKFQALFEFLWNNFANAQLPILNSNGTAGARGANATADWNANKRLPLPDMRARFPLGRTAEAMGTTGGEAAHVLTIAEMPSHTSRHQANDRRRQEAGRKTAGREGENLCAWLNLTGR